MGRYNRLHEQPRMLIPMKNESRAETTLFEAVFLPFCVVLFLVALSLVIGECSRSWREFVVWRHYPGRSIFSLNTPAPEAWLFLANRACFLLRFRYFFVILRYFVIIFSPSLSSPFHLPRLDSIRKVRLVYFQRSSTFLRASVTRCSNHRCSIRHLVARM